MNTDTSMVKVIRNVIILGMGLGTAMVLFTIIVQNAVEYRVMGAATAALTFFRSIGATLGTAVLGSLLTSTFIREYATHVPASL